MIGVTESYFTDAKTSEDFSPEVSKQRCKDSNLERHMSESVAEVDDFPIKFKGSRDTLSLK